MWHDIELMKGFSHVLMGFTIVFGMLTAICTGAHYYVERRVGELEAEKQRLTDGLKEESRLEREATLRTKVEDAERGQREATAKLEKLGNQVEGVRFSVYGDGGLRSFRYPAFEVNRELQQGRVPSPVASSPVLLRVAHRHVK